MRTMTGSVAARIAEASAVRPSARQLAWQRREFYGFVHFGMNTMTDREWGLGHEDPALFDPDALDAAQWVAAAKDAGMTALILTCKHHDGFALWPSAFSSHTVAASPWRNGRGDVVRELADACTAAGLGFGVYLSPWDRTEATYGTGEAYDDFFVGQLTELLTHYGEIVSVWLDGAVGEGPDGRVQHYDWDRYYRVIRELQPNAVIHICGPDVRWCGNEAGHTRAEEWSVVPESLRNAERVSARSQHTDDPAFARQVRSDEEDLGSRAALCASDEELVWYPAEVNTSIRPGWFHHASEDEQVRTADELFGIYRRSVGGNSTFLLNVPPNRHGQLSANDIRVLRELGDRVRELSERDLASAGAVHWEDEQLRVSWSAPVLIDTVVLGEDIAQGQQIDGVVVETTGENGTIELARAESIGYRRIIDLPPQHVSDVTVRVTSTRGPVAFSEFAVLRPSAFATARRTGEHTRDR